MRAFGRILDTTGMPYGGPMQLEGAPILHRPTISPHSMVNEQQRPMFQQGVIQNPPVTIQSTYDASGGCVPICAAEITPVRNVRWTYLMHGHGGNMPHDVVVGAFNPLDVYVCMMVYSVASSLYAAQEFQSSYFEALDPNNVIPNANALLIYGDHTSLVISRQAMIAVTVV